MVLRMGLEMLGQIIDPGRQECDLHSGDPGSSALRPNDPMISDFFSFVIAIARPRTAGFDQKPWCPVKSTLEVTYSRKTSRKCNPPPSDQSEPSRTDFPETPDGLDSGPQVNL